MSTIDYNNVLGTILATAPISLPAVSDFPTGDGAILINHFGEMGRHIWHLANGIDDRTVFPDREAKSVSTETTFAQDIEDRSILRNWLLDLVDHLASRLRHEGIWARTIDLKIRSSDFRTVTRSTTLSEPTNLTNVIWKATGDLFERSLTSELMPVRLLGVGATKLTKEPITQGNLRGIALTRHVGGIVRSHVQRPPFRLAEPVRSFRP